MTYHLFVLGLLLSVRFWSHFEAVLAELYCQYSKSERTITGGLLFLAKRGRRPRVAGFIILSLKGLRRDEISCGVYGHVFMRLVCAGNDVTRPRAGGLMV